MLGIVERVKLDFVEGFSIVMDGYDMEMKALEVCKVKRRWHGHCVAETQPAIDSWADNGWGKQDYKHKNVWPG